MTRWNELPINPNLSPPSLDKTKLKAVLGGGTKTAAGAIDWMSVQIINNLITHAIKVFAGVWGSFFQKAPPQKTKAILGGGPKMAAGAIDWSSAQIKNYIDTPCNKSF